MSSQESYAAYKKRKYLSRVSAKKRIRPTYMGKRVPIYRSLMNGTGIHTVIKSCTIPMNVNSTGFSFDVNPSGPQPYFAIYFTLQNVYIAYNASNISTVAIPGFTDLSALFDDIMIARIDMTIMTGCDPTTYQATSGTLSNGSAVLVLCNDYNDKLAPSALGDVQQYADSKNYVLANNYVHKRSIKPKFLSYVLDSAGVSQPSSPKTGFVKSTIDIEHYGMKGALALNAPGVSKLLWNFKIKFLCRTQK